MASFAADMQAPTLHSILDGWASSSTVGQPSDRRAFTQSLQGDPNDLLEILLRLTRGERNPAASASGSGSLGPLATAIRADSPFASHQTHVSLAILAMYRLTTDYAAKAGEKSEVVNEKISDIIKSLPLGMITRSLDGLFKEWNAK
jgi:20S proteasome subunit alpha 6